MQKYNKLFLIVSSLFIAVILLSANIMAADYIIGPEDVLQISFWQDPTLNQQVMVRQDGKITLSIIGEITAVDMTSKELAEKIEKNVSIYNKKISQATVTVVRFNSQKIFLAGQIDRSGKMTFEVIPDIWTIIKEAGGATDQGDLTRVTIIRSEESGGEIIYVNVLEAVAKGTIDKLPKIRKGDTIEVPKMVGGVPGRQLTTDYSDRKNLYYIIGQVLSPGHKPYEGETDIMDAIGKAGGLTGNADWDNAKIISKNGDGTSVIHFSLREYLNNGKARRIKIKPEDTIVIGEKKRALFSWRIIRDIAAVAGTVISFAYLIDRR